MGKVSCANIDLLKIVYTDMNRVKVHAHGHIFRLGPDGKIYPTVFTPCCGLLVR